MKVKELRQKNNAELQKELSAMQERLRVLRFKLHSQELKNPKEINLIKKDIARTLMILGEAKANS